MLTNPWLSVPGATCFAALSTCPGLLQFAPLALQLLHFQIESMNQLARLETGARLAICGFSNELQTWVAAPRLQQTY